MGKLKEHYLSNLNEQELDEMLSQSIEDENQYFEWLNSQEYVDFVNDQLNETNPHFSFSDIQSALKYASESVTIYPEEVGKEVYDILFSEKVEEYLKNRKDELEKIYR